MKILGVGTDIVNVKRIERIVKKNKISFLEKFLQTGKLKKFTATK